MQKTCERKNENEKKEENTCLLRHFPRGSSFLSAAVIMCPDKKKLQGKGLIPASGSRLQSITAGKSEQEREGATPSCPQWRAQENAGMNVHLLASAQSQFLHSDTVQDALPSKWFYCGLGVSINSIKTIPHPYALSPNQYRQPVVGTLLGYLDCAKLTKSTIMHTIEKIFPYLDHLVGLSALHSHASERHISSFPLKFPQHTVPPFLVLSYLDPLAR